VAISAVLLSQLADRLVALDEEGTLALTEQALSDGLPAFQIITDGLSRGMDEVGARFEAGEYFLPELLVAADVLKHAVEIVRPHLAGDAIAERGTVVIGTVQGDIHDVGKNIVKLMLETSGYRAIDLGVDVSPERFVEAQKESQAEIMAASALISSTVPQLKAIVEAARAADPTVSIMVGGAPVTEDVARHYAADGYADDAAGAVRLAARLVETARSKRTTVSTADSR
jgi:methanogenic corrinoid protein MtbC1